MKTKEQIQKLLLKFVAEKHTLTASRVFSVLLGVLEFDEDICFSRQEVATMLGIQVSGMGLAIKEIVNSGFITQTKKVGTTNLYRLNIQNTDDFVFHKRGMLIHDGDTNYRISAVHLRKVILEAV